MKLLLLSDLHLSPEKNPVGRLDNLYETQFQKLDFILNYAGENNCIILQAGDLFHIPRNWYLLSDTITILNKFPDIEIYSIFGQHDMFLYSKELQKTTNLGILNETGYINILNEFPIGYEGINIYGASWGEEVPKIKNKNIFNILVVHKDISDAPLFYDHKYTKAEKFLNENEFDLIVCGDIHKSFFVKNNNKILLNTGPILRRESTEYNLIHKPNFWVYNTNTKDYSNIIIPHKSAKEVLSRGHIESKKEKEEVLKEFILEVNKDGVKLTGFDFKTKLNNFIKVNKISKPVVEYLEKLINDEK